jgi:hypothetical protein
MFAKPVLAWYEISISNCDITRVSSDNWRASFTVNSKFNSRFVPSDQPQAQTFLLLGLSTLDSRTRKPSWSAGLGPITTWSNIVYNKSNLYVGSSERSVNIMGSRSDRIITAPSSEVSIDFTTKDNNSYPTLSVTIGYYSQVSPGATALVINAYRYWYVTFSEYGGCTSGKSAPNVPPIEEVDIPEPEFKLSSAVWELDTADVGNIPTVAAIGNGYAASIKNIASNNLCVNYVTAGVKNKTYALSVTNSASMQGGRNLFTLQGVDSQLLYNLQLASNTGVAANDYSFPATSAKYITLTQTASSVTGRSEMCWSPKINLFKDASTKEGMHTGTMNFVISPKA